VQPNNAWRLAGLLALLLYAALALITLRFVVHNILFTAICCVTVLLLAYAGWMAFTGSGTRQRRGYLLVAVSAVAVVAELVYFLAAINGWLALIGFAGMAIVYVLLAGTLRSRYWQAARLTGERVLPTAAFQRPYLIINPKSGNGRAVKAHIGELAERQSVRTITLRKEDDVASVAEKAARAGADVLGISGGDGSIGAVVKVALAYGLPVVVLPGGTRCHFARDIGLDPKRIADALTGFHGVERRVDVGEINGRIFLNNASFGLYADIVDQPGYRENKLQATRNVLQQHLAGTKDTYELRFAHGRHHYQKAVQVLVSVNRYKTLNVMETGRREKLDEGVLQITVIRGLTDDVVRHLLRAASIDTVFGRNDMAEIDQWDAPSFRISSKERTIVAGVDGERESYVTPVTIRVLPKALRLYVPAEGVRNRPENAFSRQFVRQLWRTERT